MCLQHNARGIISQGKQWKIENVKGESKKLKAQSSKWGRYDLSFIYWK